MHKICLDYGHGGSDPGAIYKGRKESDDNLNVGREVAKELRRHGIIVGETRSTNVAISLKERSDFANRQDYDYFISIHRNAFKPEQAEGVETFVYTNTTVKSKTLAEKIQKSLVDVGFIDRGIKKANFHVLRETKAPAVLVEIGFSDNTKDNELFDSKRGEIINMIAKAILYQLGMSYKEEKLTSEAPKKQTLYRVMAGSFTVRENAKKQIQKLNEAGFDAIIMIFDN